MDKDYNMKYKYRSAITHVLATFSGKEAFLSSLRVNGFIVDRNLPVLLEKVREFVNSGLQKRQITLLINKTPFIDSDTMLFIGKVIDDVMNARLSYKNGLGD